MTPRANRPDSALPGASVPGSGSVQFGQGPDTAMSLKWSALHDAAATVAVLAGMPGEEPQPDVRHFPTLIRDAESWRREAAEQGIEDLSAILEAGLSALLAVHAQGANPTAPALALWREFHAARDALLALVPSDRD